MQKLKIAVFPGSFDPITNAHFEVIMRACPLFDKIYVAVGVNTSKKPLFELDVKLNLLNAIFKANPTIEIDSYNGLTIDYCKRVDANFIIRGIRNGTDFDFEQAIAQNNLLLAPSIETYFLISTPGYGHISSSVVRDIFKNGGDIRHLVPKEVLQYL